MSEKKHFPWFDQDSGRWVIAGREVHCGDCFQVRREYGPWLDVRAEMSGADGWYLHSLPLNMNARDWDLYEARWYD
jgi:hypothetical protein